ncbi:hypothetical protein [Mycolicibacterium conceptionense]|uniref:hypothetical protein n=1 Tax=Mycolicibacterium conceptionense TaxID=451644 RepID=UPI000AD08ED5|nr:hypothetical protein [Mycolicibacterium conceptionense]
MNDLGNLLTIIGLAIAFGGVLAMFTQTKSRTPAWVIIAGAAIIMVAAGFQLAGNLGA